MMKLPRCPNGSRRDKKTKECVPNVKKSKQEKLKRISYMDSSVFTLPTSI